MQRLSQRTTVYLEPDVSQALHLRSIETSRSMSDLINESLRADLAEDAFDLAICEERRNEPTLSFEELVKEMKHRDTI